MSERVVVERRPCGGGEIVAYVEDGHLYYTAENCTLDPAGPALYLSGVLDHPFD